METTASLVGRERELAAIDAALSAVADGESRVLALAGEPGIGKSALLTHARERAEAAGLVVFDGTAAEHEADVPFGLAIDALDDRVAGMHARRLEALGQGRLADLAAVLPAAAAPKADPGAAGPAERFRYHRAVRALLELLGGEGPLALFLDDVHWADEASVELVLHLLRRPPRTPHLLAVAMRSTGQAPRVLDALRAATGTELLVVEPLARDAALALVADVEDEDTRLRIESEAGGNPLYLQELARLAPQPGAPLPPTLIAAVELEVSSLPPASRALLDGAAVAGDPFDPELAAAAGGLDPSDALALLDRLIQADLVRPLSGTRRFRFRHPLVRRAVYDAAPGGWRLAAHERAANELADRRASAVERAYHVEQAARPGEEGAIEVLIEAAAQSTSAAPLVAARWYSAALSLLADGDPRRLGLLESLALALAATGQLERSHDAMVEALALDPAGDAAAQLPLTLACAQTERLLGRYADAERRLLGALDAAGSGGEQAQIELQLAILALMGGDPERLGRWSGRALTHGAETDGAVVAGAEAMLALSAVWTARPDDANVRLDRGVALLARLPDEALAEHLYAPWCLATALILTERNRDAAEVAARGVRVAKAFAQEELLLSLLGHRAIALYNLAELPEALDVVEAADEMARLHGVPDQLLGTVMIRIVVLDAMGESAAARNAADDARRLAPEIEPGLGTVTALTAAATLELERDPEGCIREIVEVAGESLERAEPAWAATWLARTLTEAALALDRTGDADRWATLAEQVAGALQRPGPSVRARTARAHVMLAGGDADGAAGLALAAAADGDAIEVVLDAIKARLVAASALAAGGRRAEALATLRQAGDTAARGGAVKLRDQAARELRRLGEHAAPARPRVAAGSGLDSLTHREREVTELVAQGQSNKQVAAALFLSEKTVEKHLYQAFRKLGVGSRAELAAAVARGG